MVASEATATTTATTTTAPTSAGPIAEYDHGFQGVPWAKKWQAEIGYEVAQQVADARARALVGDEERLAAELEAAAARAGAFHEAAARGHNSPGLSLATAEVARLSAEVGAVRRALDGHRRDLAIAELQALRLRLRRVEQAIAQTEAQARTLLAPFAAFVGYAEAPADLIAVALSGLVYQFTIVGRAVGHHEARFPNDARPDPPGPQPEEGPQPDEEEARRCPGK